MFVYLSKIGNRKKVDKEKCQSRKKVIKQTVFTFLSAYKYEAPTL